MSIFIRRDQGEEWSPAAWPTRMWTKRRIGPSRRTWSAEEFRPGRDADREFEVSGSPDRERFGSSGRPSFDWRLCSTPGTGRSMTRRMQTAT
jgi:hypothetical protein